MDRLHARVDSLVARMLRLRRRPAVRTGLPVCAPAASRIWFGFAPAEARDSSAAAGASLDHVALPGVVAPRDGEAPVTPREGGTPLPPVPRLAAQQRFRDLRVKEKERPHGFVQAHGLAAAVTRTALGGRQARSYRRRKRPAWRSAAYAARAGPRARVYRRPPRPHHPRPDTAASRRSVLVMAIGDCGKRPAGYSGNGALDVSTLREPYRIEGKKPGPRGGAGEQLAGPCRRDRLSHRWWHRGIACGRPSPSSSAPAGSRKSAPLYSVQGRGVARPS